MTLELLFSAYCCALYVMALPLVTLFNRWAKVEESGGKGFSHSLEALRGIAAMMVFTTHSMMYFGNLIPGSPIPSFPGAVGVILFFFLTGHLFWSQVLTGSFNYTTFFPKRLKRLVPAATAMVGTVMFFDWLVLARMPSLTFDHIMLLVRNLAFGFGGTNDVFFPETVQRINVIWSLKWEWLFYLWLPLASCFKSLPAITGFLIFLIMVFMDPRQIDGGNSDAIFLLAFFLGGLMSYADKLRPDVLVTLGKIFASPYFAILWIGVIALYIRGLDAPTVPVRSVPLLLVSFGIFLYFWASKHNSQKWIFAPPVQLIGKVSYSLYLWHLAINWYVIKISSRLFNIDSILAYMALSAIMLVIVIAVAMASYVAVERPFMARKPSATIPPEPAAPTLAEGSYAGE
ncbi:MULTISPECIES: acyltransferase family protein [unclassified Mesorhizobium]|uniref:acyltransferase family protein n=1 Tax=unclassified Mesorhizobium TaxID=325217 RepID=UPI00112E35FA|nr:MULTISPECIES: acyltransferase [unclassified Mesorhizobium]MBZ9702492.1 acyltransferase [Mesorhizobium sp. CO1-1-3]MBZ9948792.1 acyltransferase [Mesorhizobium sp. BR1-1-11]TPJ09590.1 acyltransferase [Mesorhizobium sp. B2-8-1]